MKLEKSDNKNRKENYLYKIKYIVNSFQLDKTIAAKSAFREGKWQQDALRPTAITAKL